MIGMIQMIYKKEIWTIVHYINKLQDSDYGSPNTEGDSEEVAAVTGDDQ